MVGRLAVLVSYTPRRSAEQDDKVTDSGTDKWEEKDAERFGRDSPEQK
jgi:hypothetical protein